MAVRLTRRRNIDNMVFAEITKDVCWPEGYILYSVYYSWSILEPLRGSHSVSTIN